MISLVFRWLAKTHIKNTERDYPSRRLRHIDIFEQFLEDAMNFDKKEKYLNDELFKEACESLDKQKQRLRAMFLTSLFAAFITISYSAGSDLVITIGQFKIENLSFIFELLLVIFGISTYYAADYTTKALTVESVIDRWIDKRADKIKAKGHPLLHDYNRINFAALCRINSGIDLLSHITSRRRIKIKFIFNSIDFRTYLAAIDEFITTSVLILYVSAYISAVIAINTNPVHDSFSAAISLIILTIFLVAAAFKLLVLFALFQAILAKGDKNEKIDIHPKHKDLIL